MKLKKNRVIIIVAYFVQETLQVASRSLAFGRWTRQKMCGRFDPELLVFVISDKWVDLLYLYTFHEYLICGDFILQKCGISDKIKLRAAHLALKDGVFVTLRASEVINSEN